MKKLTGVILIMYFILLVMEAIAVYLVADRLGVVATILCIVIWVLATKDALIEASHFLKALIFRNKS